MDANFFIISGLILIFFTSLRNNSSVSLPILLILSLLPLNLILFTEVIFRTSVVIASSCGATTCPPSFQYALYPLYSGGLCDAVITTPLWHLKCLIAVSYTHLTLPTKRI